ncbi:MAG: type II secretion system protein GspG [Candidatus Sumerlaeaceae bacterium]|nr:type II secretion system protein GspG [Candidatus Sumerlaeaceae bacterium]
MTSRPQHAGVAGFTLIELLVAVAIIAILAAMAVPHFLEAQTRSKVSAAKSDMRVVAGALESYFVDNNHYPPPSGVGIHFQDPFAQPIAKRLIPLTTPVAYVSSIFPDKFRAKGGWMFEEQPLLFDTYDYVTPNAIPGEGSGESSGAAWRIASAGPDLYQAYGGRLVTDTECNARGVDYDPTNGSVSTGDIVRVGPVDTRFPSATDITNPKRPGIVRAPAYKEQW